MRISVNSSGTDLCKSIDIRCVGFVHGLIEHATEQRLVRDLQVQLDCFYQTKYINTAFK